MSDLHFGHRPPDRCWGFSLIEMSVVLLLVTLLLGSILIPLSSHVY